MKILIIAPHPDDEVIGCGGFIAKQIELGDSVQVLFLTSGERGCPDYSLDEARAIRKTEAQNVADYLGYSIVGFWDLPDGQLAYSEDLAQRLYQLVEVLKPNMVLSTHERDAHVDHRTCGKLVHRVQNMMYDNKPEFLGYEVWTPHQYPERLSNITAWVDKKLEALAKYPSQMSRNKFDVAALSLARYRGIMQGSCDYAEAFTRFRESGRENVKIGIALLTYAPSADHPRAQYARKTLTSTLTLLDPGPGNELHIHIADDGSAPEHIEQLKAIAAEFGYEASVTNAQRGGYGKSYNLMMQALHSSCDLILPLEDDWELTKPLRLEHAVKALDDPSSGISSIRLGYMGFTQELRGTVLFRHGQTYLVFDPSSPEPHVFCGHPRIETVAYERAVGPWPEGLRAGETEWEITKRQEARTEVAWPLDLMIPASQDWGCMYAHIGSVSYNQTIPEGVQTI